MELKLRTLNGIHEEIRMAADNMDTKEPEPLSLLEGMRSRRMAPLGMVGSLSKSLFGLITEDDTELINKNIDKLFRDQADLIKLWRKDAPHVSRFRGALQYNHFSSPHSKKYGGPIKG